MITILELGIAQFNPAVGQIPRNILVIYPLCLDERKTNFPYKF